MGDFHFVSLYFLTIFFSYSDEIFANSHKNPQDVGVSTVSAISILESAPLRTAGKAETSATEYSSNNGDASNIWRQQMQGCHQNQRCSHSRKAITSGIPATVTISAAVGSSSSWEASNRKVTRNSNNIKAIRKSSERETATINSRNIKSSKSISSSRACSSRGNMNIRNIISSIDVKNSTWKPEKMQ